MPGGISSTPLVISHRYVWQTGGCRPKWSRYVGLFLLRAFEMVRSHLQTLLEVSDVGLLCLQQLGHNEPEPGRQLWANAREEPNKNISQIQWIIIISLLLPRRLPLFLVDLMVGIPKFYRLVICQARGNDVQLQVFGVLRSETILMLMFHHLHLYICVWNVCCHLRADAQAPL